jgi:phosphatidylglycerophosphatase C
MSAPAPERPVAVFDLDGTLLRGDGSARLVRRLILRDWYRAAPAFVFAPVLATMFFLPVLRRYALTAVIWLATVGMTPERFQAVVDEFATGHAAEANQIAVVLDRLRAHLGAGDRVVIATGCLEPLATAVCRVLGLHPVEVIAARLRQGRNFVWPSRACGMWSALPAATGPASYGVEKVRRLTAAGITLPVAYAYTDSAADLPLLLAATNRFVVDPAPRRLRRIQVLAGPGCTALWSRRDGEISGRSQA